MVKHQNGSQIHSQNLTITLTLRLDAPLDAWCVYTLIICTVQFVTLYSFGLVITCPHFPGT